MLLVDEILTEAGKAADLRNNEVVDRLLQWIGRTGTCKFCQCRNDYVYCKIQARRIKRDLRQGAYVRVNQFPNFCSDFPRSDEEKMNELFKMAKEFRAAMYSQGQCTCSPSLILSRERQVHGRRY